MPDYTHTAMSTDLVSLFGAAGLQMDSNRLGPSLAITKALEDTIRGRSQVSHELLQLKIQQIHSPWLCFAGGCL
jgi:hypothetical protein